MASQKGSDGSLTATDRQSNKNAKRGAAETTDIKPAVGACRHHETGCYGQYDKRCLLIKLFIRY